MKITIALALTVAGIASYGQFRNPHNPLPFNGNPIVAQSPPPPHCPGAPGCPKHEPKL